MSAVLKATPGTDPKRHEPGSVPSRCDALTHLEWLESEAIHIMREVVAEAKNPALLFSGGKDSIVMLRIAEKAFRPDRFPFPLLHIDTEHNFSEVIAFRDARAAELGERLIVRSVGESIRTGRAKLNFNDLGAVRLAVARALIADPYAVNRATGSFILIDEATHHTVAGGMISELTHG